MPSINLPTIDFAIDGGSNKQELQQILDALTKYRKELNFLLMNLDTDNMPAVAGLLEDLDGNFSMINQQIDGITLAVGNAQGDISALEITVGGIQTTVASHGTTIGSHTSQITQLSNEISSVVSFTDVTGNQIASKINQTATTIEIEASKIDLTGITTIYGYYDSQDYVTVNNGRIDLYADGENALRFSTSTSGGTIYSPDGPAVVILDPLLVSDDIYTDYDLYVSGDADITGRLYVDGEARFYDSVYINGDDVVTADYDVHIDTTSYGINIQSSRGQTISILWGASLG